MSWQVLKGEMEAIQVRNRAWLAAQDPDRRKWTPEQIAHKEQMVDEYTALQKRFLETQREARVIERVTRPENDERHECYHVYWSEIAGRVGVRASRSFRTLVEAELFYRWMESRQGMRATNVRREMAEMEGA